ncbi:hypothetical protein D1872_223910 [compost metagenome]
MNIREEHVHLILPLCHAYIGRVTAEWIGLHASQHTAHLGAWNNLMRQLGCFCTCYKLMVQCLVGRLQLVIHLICQYAATRIRADEHDIDLVKC